MRKMIMNIIRLTFNSIFTLILDFTNSSLKSKISKIIYKLFLFKKLFLN